MKKTYLIKLGSIEDIPVGQGMCFIVQETEVAVFRLRDGRVLAVENRCPHRQGPLSEGVIGNGKVICPLHGHKFDLISGQGTEKQECVKTFKVCAQSGEIILEFPSDEIQGVVALRSS